MKPRQITAKQLRAIVSETIKTTSTKKKLREVGIWSNKADDLNPMGPANFETVIREEFHDLVMNISQAFEENIIEIARAGFPPGDSKDYYENLVEEAASELHYEIMDLIAKKSEEVAEKF